MLRAAPHSDAARPVCTLLSFLSYFSALLPSSSSSSGSISNIHKVYKEKDNVVEALRGKSLTLTRLVLFKDFLNTKCDDSSAQLSTPLKKRRSWYTKQFFSTLRITCYFSRR